MKSFEVIAETRRKWSADERRLIVEETLSSPVSVVARKHRVAVSLLFRWRNQAGLPGKKAARKVPAALSGTSSASLPAVSFAPVKIGTPAAAAQPVSGEGGTIEIELANGHKLRVSGNIHSDALKQVIAALGG